jgi:hypothetical protein
MAGARLNPGKDEAQTAPPFRMARDVGKVAVAGRR